MPKIPMQGEHAGLAALAVKLGGHPTVDVGCVAEVAIVKRGERPAPTEATLPAVGAFFSQWIGDETSEVVAVLVVGNRGEPLGCEIVARGGFGSVAADPKLILRPAIALGGAGVWISHNHPSGDPTPSDADKLAQRGLNAAAAMLGVSVADHVVVASHGKHASLRAAMESDPAPGPMPTPGPGPAPRPAPAKRKRKPGECRGCSQPVPTINPVMARMPHARPLIRAVEAGYCSTDCAESAPG